MTQPQPDIPNRQSRRRREWAQFLELSILLLALCGGAFVLYKVLLLFG